ncbi:dentin sialophosphoprotein-like isoform X2 [Venturia canescens]|nr:dentin sialophosphoprotein-like isoform X2 [Venturia canescens]
MKARAAAKRDRLCGNASSDDDSHNSSQSSMKFRSEDSIQTSVQRTDSYSRRTRGARTERYIKRMSRDDCNSSSDFSNPVDSNVRRSTDFPKIPSPVGSSSRFFDRLPPNLNVQEIQECDKFTWPKTNLRRSNPSDAIYGSLRPRQITVVNEEQSKKVLPPEPPPRSSKSRIFSTAPNPPFPFNNQPVTQQPCRRYYEPRNPTNVRSCMSDNETFHDCRWTEVAPVEFPTESINPYRNENYDTINHSHRLNSPVNRLRREYPPEQRNYATRDGLENTVSSPTNQARTTRSLPKGVELFSRQKLANCADDEKSYKVPEPSWFDSSESYHPVPRPRTRRESNQSPESKKILDENEAERKRSSRNLQEALFELEAIYNSLRLSDPDLLERAEQRTMDEYRDNAARSIAEHSSKNLSDASSNENHEVSHWNSQSDTNLRISDDMAYRRMNPKERPSSVNGQSSLPQISYLATSPNLSIRDNDSFRPRSSSSRRSSPDLTRDDVLFRSISHAINTLKVIEPQPPFGIPLGPVTGSTESDYLHVKPTSTKFGQTRSLYIPKSEPDVVSDDLAFRNLRKDKDNHVGTNKNTNYYLQMDSLIEPHLTFKYDTSSLGTRKKRAVRSNSVDSTNQDTDWYNEYVKSTQKLSFSPELRGQPNRFDSTNSSSYGVTNNATNYHDNVHLDINGNQPKSALQRKIQVYVPRDNSPYDNEKYLLDYDCKLAREPCNSMRKLMATESEDSCPERCCNSRDSSASDVRRDNDDKNIEQFTDQEISEYKQLCQDLEKLIRQTADDGTKDKDDAEDQDMATGETENNSQSEFDEWERLFNDDYEVPASILNFNESLEVPSTERDDDHSSSRSVGLSSDNLPITSRKIGDDDLLSSASELGICSNNGSLPDSVYDKFNQLLREVNDLPVVEYTNKVGKYPTDELEAARNHLRENERNDERKPSGSANSSDDGTATRNSHDSPRLLEYRAKVMSQNRALEDQDLTKSLERLKSLTRRMRSEDANREFLELASNDESHFDFEGKKVDKPSYQEESSGSTDSVYDKFNQLLQEVNDAPPVENTNKIGKYPPVEPTTSIDNPEEIAANNDSRVRGPELEISDTQPGQTQEPSPGTSGNISNLQEHRTKVVSPNNFPVNQRSGEASNNRSMLLTRRVKSVEDESHRTRNEGRNTRPKPKIDEQTFAYREG